MGSFPSTRRSSAHLDTIKIYLDRATIQEANSLGGPAPGPRFAAQLTVGLGCPRDAAHTDSIVIGNSLYECHAAIDSAAHGRSRRGAARAEAARRGRAMCFDRGVSQL